MLEKSCCANCLYFDEDELNCHLDPPVYVRKDTWEFPKVETTSWCGKFIRKEHSHNIYS